MDSERCHGANTWVLSSNAVIDDEVRRWAASRGLSLGSEDDSQAALLAGTADWIGGAVAQGGGGRLANYRQVCGACIDRDPLAIAKASRAGFVSMFLFPDESAELSQALLNSNSPAAGPGSQR